jgi:hypothetical protein
MRAAVREVGKANADVEKTTAKMADRVRRVIDCLEFEPMLNSLIGKIF